MEGQMSIFEIGLDKSDEIERAALTNERTNERYVTHIVYLNNPGHLRMSFRS